MLGLSGTSLYAVFVFVYETLGNISFDILGPRAFRKYMVSGQWTTDNGQQNVKIELEYWKQNSQLYLSCIYICI